MLRLMTSAREDLLLGGGSGPGRANTRGIAGGRPAQHLHADGLAQGGHARPDRPHPEDTQGLAEHLREELARPFVLPHLGIEDGDLSSHREHEGQGMLSHREGIDAGSIADGYAAHAGGLQIEIVGARAPDGHHLEGGAGREHAVGEAGVRADIDGDGGAADAPDQLLLLIGAALGEDDDVTELFRPLVGRSALEDRRKVVGDRDHSWAAEKMAWAADTPAPASHL